MKVDYKEYTQKFLPEATYQLEKIYNKLGMKTEIKTTIKTKSKYWDLNKKYPTTLDNFISKNFKKKKPKDLEGIWEQDFMGNPIYYGFLKEKETYHAYYIDTSNAKITQTSGSFFKDIFNAPKADYGILSGTKFGIFSYDKKKNKGTTAKEWREIEKNNPGINKYKFLKFKGISTAIHTFSDEFSSYPINMEMEYDVILVGETELRGESKDQIMLEEKYGQSRRSYKIWPQEENHEASIHQENRKTSVHQEIWVQCSDKNCKDYSNHFQIREASLELRVCPECKGPLKRLSGKINPDSKNSGVMHPNENEEENKIGTSAGSGFFVTNKGHIITNYHVVQNRKNIKFLFNNEEVSAKLVSSDQQLDLALLKAKIKNKSFIKFSNQSPKKTQSILVAGFPHAKAVSDDLIITGGIINSLKGLGNNTSMLQIDANINRGNSGGPIVDKNTGNLVAVATMKLIGKDASIDNMNFGIKSSQVKDFLEADNTEVTIKNNKFNISDLENSTVFIYCE